ncbi:aldose 1-epimerase [Filimonas effusa]|uniref:Aldose 1-epimerase n=1 Tax=Filimonas effusa TaxID=2508721 RepID=A0A4Q1D6C9_9BACT|nr:aldose 1-epimerase [Filimonas effusa]RXK83433.1 aldose 1-epimerase [Filimonas effusa]
MSFEVRISGNNTDQAIILEDTTSGTKAEIYRFGALLNNFSVVLESGLFNTVDGFQNPAGATQTITPFFQSAKLSPFPCRLKLGKYHFGGKDFTIQKYYDAPNALHGLLYDAVFDIVSTASDASGASVTLQHHYNGSDAGYPFNYDIQVIWELKQGNTLTVTTTVTHENPTAIPIADGWHPYFKLDDTIDSCTLQFNSNSMLEFDATLIPTGKIHDDKRFADPAVLEGIFLDNCFALDTTVQQPVCILEGKQLRLTIIPDQSYPYLQLYTPSHRKSIAIENLSAAPDAFNNGIGLMRLEKNTPAIFSTTYRLETI